MSLYYFVSNTNYLYILRGLFTHLASVDEFTLLWKWHG